MVKKMWGGRFKQATDTSVEAYTASLFFDVQLFFEDILGSMAHVEMLAHCGILSAEECQALQMGLREVAALGSSNALALSIKDEDVHMNIERLLLDKAGPVALKLHTGRSRNDQVALDMHLYVRRHIVDVIQLLINLQDILLVLAEQHQHIVMPGYTHLQRAQPIRLGQYWLAYANMFARDISRFHNLWERANQSPLGAGALAGTSLGINKHYTAKILGFDGVYSNTLDAVSDRDFITEFVANSALTMMHLSRMSEELVIWSSKEFGFVTFDDAFCTGSSMMPQKKNPDVVELARGKTGRVYGALVTLLTLQKALPLAYNKDLQEDKEPLFDTVKTVFQTLAIYPNLLQSLTIHQETMQKAAENGFLNATALAEYLVQKAVPFRTAHEIVGKLVAYCCDQNCELNDLELDYFKQFTEVFDNDVYQVLSANHHKDESHVKEQINLIEKYNTSAKTWLVDKQHVLQSVYERFSIFPFTINSQQVIGL